MAKKRRLINEKKEEEYEFAPSNFDEKEFILKERYSAKVFLFVIMFSLMIGLVNSFIWDALEDKTIVTLVDTLIVFGFMFAMKPLLVSFGIRADLLETKTLLGHYFFYLTMALGFCVLCINTLW